MTFIAGVKRTSIYAATIFLSLAATTATAACSDPAAASVDWGGCDLREMNLRNAQLTGASLSYADLRGVDMRSANLINANMIGADLRDADLIGSNLYGANLTDAILTGTQLLHAVWVSGQQCAIGSIGRCN